MDMDIKCFFMSIFLIIADGFCAQQDYHDKDNFFPDESQQGNFSLHVDDLRNKDEGKFIYNIYSQKESGFSTSHIMALVLCFVAGSGAVLCCVIYYRSNNTVTSSTVWNFQLSLAFCLNLCMFFAFIFWGHTDGFLNETVTCCGLFILRSFLLIKYSQDILNKWIRFSSIKRELAVSTVFVYSIFYMCALRQSAYDTDPTRRIIFGILLGFVLKLCCNLYDGYIRMHIKWIGLFLLSLAQFFLLVSAFGLPSPAFLAVPVVHAILLMCMPCKYFLKRWINILWIIICLLLDIILVIYVHVCILQRLEDYFEWICIIAYLEVLRIKVAFEGQDFEHSETQRQQQQIEMRHQKSNALPLCNEIMYMFGAVGLVLLNSLTLTAELILKARNGERVVKDLRVIVFPSECVFALYWLAIQIHAIQAIQIQCRSTHNQKNLHQRDRCHFKNTPKIHTVENFSAADSAVSQKHK